MASATACVISLWPTRASPPPGSWATTSLSAATGSTSPTVRTGCDSAADPTCDWRIEAELRALRDRLDSLERAEHVAPVAALPQEPAERAPDLGEEVVAEVE